MLPTETNKDTKELDAVKVRIRLYRSRLGLSKVRVIVSSASYGHE